MYQEGDKSISELNRSSNGPRSRGVWRSGGTQSRICGERSRSRNVDAGDRNSVIFDSIGHGDKRYSGMFNRHNSMAAY